MARPRFPLPTLLACTLAVIAWLPPPAPAADAWPVARGPSREPIPYRYDPKSVKALPRDFLDDAVACVLYSGTTHSVEADGTIETVSHEVTRLNGRKGIEKLGEYRNISYTPSYQKLTLNEARIHKADGRAVAIEPRHAHLRDVATDYQTYDPEKQLIVSFPSLEVGDTIEVKWTVRGKNPEHAGHFFTRYSFGDPLYPVVHDEFQVRLPKARALKYATTPGKIDALVSEAGGFRLYRWKSGNTRRLPKDENLPSKEELRTSLLCSTFASWADVGAWKQRLRADCWKCTPEVAGVVEELTKGLKSPRDRARALTYWVRRNIRYVSVGEKHDYTPHPPGKVLTNRFGDCKDTSQLLAVMLREAGLKVELATLGVLDDGQVNEAVPSPWGTHAILLATVDGKEHWIDTTARLAGWDFLPHDDRDRLCYVTDENGKLRLVRTPPLRAADNRFEQATEIWVGSDGSSRCRRTAVSHGSAAMGQRDAYLEVPAGERRRQVTAELQDSNNRTRLGRLVLDEKALQDFDRPVTARLEFEIPRLFTGSTELEGSVSDSKVWSRLLAHNLDYDREVPLVLYAPFESTHRYVLHVGPAFVLDGLPRDKTIESAWGRFSVRAKELDPAGGGSIRHLELTFHTRLDRHRVEVDDFDDFRKFHEDVNREYRVWLTLKPAQDLGSAPLLEGLLTFAPQDQRAAATLARIYSRAGRTTDATRVLRRARHYHPDDRTLLDLSVKCADNTKTEEEAQRELMRRFPQELGHALALGTNLVSQGRQADARAILTPLTTRGTPAERAQAHFQLARSHYRKDELAPALKDLEAAAELEPESVNTVRAHLLKGQILEELNRPTEATRAYRDALAVDREAEQALLSLIRLALVAKREADALDYLRRYSLLAGKDLRGLLLAAETYLKLGRYDDAFELASRARDLGFHEKAQRILGLVYLHRGEGARALAHLEKADADATVLAALLRVSVELGRLRELETYLDRATRLDKPPAALGRACERARRVQQRRAQLGKLVTVPPGKEGEWNPAVDALACAEALYALGQPPAKVKALLAQAFAEGLAIGPAHALRGRLALDRGRLARALPDAERAVALSPRDAGGYFVRGRVRLERGTAGALADLEKAAELSGRQDADVLSALADALFRAGSLADAVAAQRGAVELRPGDKELTEQLATFEKGARRGR